MRILFACMVSMETMDRPGIYSDLLRELASRGHDVCAMVPRERRSGLPTEFSDSCGVRLLKVAVGNVTKSGLLEKGVATLSIGGMYWSAFRRYFDDERFDLVVYTTPPTTLCGFIGKVKKHTGAKAYLLLKDIFPQNSLDLGMLRESGPMGLVFRHFKATEKESYELADYIGCMSEANRAYLLEHEPWIDAGSVEVNPNSVAVAPRPVPDVPALRAKLGLPAGEMVFVYGGSLGKPQDIGFLIECLKANEINPVGYFAIAGAGTDRPRLEEYFSESRPAHARLYPMLPVEEFDDLVSSADVCLLFLDHRFTIPNFPSRLLSYLKASKPVVAAVDPSTDVGTIAEENGFGFRCGSTDPDEFLRTCARFAPGTAATMGAKGRAYLEENYDVKRSCDLIERHFNG